ncbi:hypothetical protein KIPB_011264, partial [Kipferlia bialata]|eukprot:g11264.t1
MPEGGEKRERERGQGEETDRRPPKRRQERARERERDAERDGNTGAVDMSDGPRVMEPAVKVEGFPPLKELADLPLCVPVKCEIEDDDGQSLTEKADAYRQHVNQLVPSLYRDSDTLRECGNQMGKMVQDLSLAGRRERSLKQQVEERERECVQLRQESARKTQRIQEQAVRGREVAAALTATQQQLTSALATVTRLSGALSTAQERETRAEAALEREREMLPRPLSDLISSGKVDLSLLKMHLEGYGDISGGGNVHMPEKEGEKSVRERRREGQSSVARELDSFPTREKGAVSPERVTQDSDEENSSSAARLDALEAIEAIEDEENEVEQMATVPVSLPIRLSVPDSTDPEQGAAPTVTEVADEPAVERGGDVEIEEEEEDDQPVFPSDYACCADECCSRYPVEKHVPLMTAIAAVKSGTRTRPIKTRKNKVIGEHLVDQETGKPLICASGIAKLLKLNHRDIRKALESIAESFCAEASAEEEVAAPRAPSPVPTPRRRRASRTARPVVEFPSGRCCGRRCVYSLFKHEEKSAIRRDIAAIYGRTEPDSEARQTELLQLIPEYFAYESGDFSCRPLIVKVLSLPISVVKEEVSRLRLARVSAEQKAKRRSAFGRSLLAKGKCRCGLGCCSGYPFSVADEEERERERSVLDSLCSRFGESSHGEEEEVAFVKETFFAPNAASRTMCPTAIRSLTGIRGSLIRKTLGAVKDGRLPQCCESKCLTGADMNIYRQTHIFQAIAQVEIRCKRLDLSPAAAEEQWST